MLTIKHKVSFTSKNGKRRHCYFVNGTAKELETYADAQGEFYTQDNDTGKPLYFTANMYPDGTKLEIGESKEGNPTVFAVNSLQKELDIMSSPAYQGTPVAAAIASEVVKKMGISVSITKQADPQVEEVEEDDPIEEVPRDKTRRTVSGKPKR